jgi:hypothetical protein
MIADNRSRSTSVPTREQTKTPQMPAAGPHARPDLTDHDKTPGSGMFPSEEDTNPSPTG